MAREGRINPATIDAVAFFLVMVFMCVMGDRHKDKSLLSWDFRADWETAVALMVVFSILMAVETIQQGEEFLGRVVAWLGN